MNYGETVALPEPFQHRDDLSSLKSHIFHESNESGVRLWNELETVFDHHDHVTQEWSYLHDESSASSKILKNRLEGVLESLRASRRAVITLQERCKQKPGLVNQERKIASADAVRQQALITLKLLQNLPAVHESKPIASQALTMYFTVAKRELLEFLE